MNPPHLRRNFGLIFGDYVLFGVAMNLIGVSTVLPEFLRHFTASAPLIGLLPAIWNGMWLLPQLLAAQRLTHRLYKKPALVLSGVIGRPMFITVTIALVLGAAGRPALIIALVMLSVAVFFGADAINSVAWFDIVAKVIPAQRRARLFGVAQMASGVVGLGVAAFVSYMLGAGGPAFPYNYAWLFGLASAATLCGIVLLGMLVEPPESTPQQPAEWGTYLRSVRKLLGRGSAFRMVTAARLLTGLSGLSGPFFILYATEVLGLNPSVIGAFIAAQTVGGLVGSFGLGALAERGGPGAAVRAAVLVSLAAPLVALLVLPLRGASWLWLPYAGVFLLTGVANSAGMLGWMNYVLEIAPPGERPTYAGLTNTLTGLLVPIPVLGGWLLQSSSYSLLFAVSAIGPLLAIWLAWQLPRPAVAAAM